MPGEQARGDRPGMSARPLRILATTTPLQSHLWNLVPALWALRSAGHDVRVAALPNIAWAVEESSLPALLVGPLLDLSLMPGQEAVASDSPAPFIRAAAQMGGLLAHGILAALEYFRPQLVLYEAMDLAGPLVAQHLGVPAVYVSCGPPYAPAAVENLRRGGAALRRRMHMDEQVSPPALVLDVCPPSYRDPAHAVAAPYQSMRFVPYNGPGAVPAWLLQPPERPQACLSAGTSGPEGELIGRVARIIHEVRPDMEIIVPMAADAPGRAMLSGSKVRVVDWLPLKLLFAAGCDLVVHHGGPGTALTALSYGLPQIVLHDRRHLAGADHYINGRLLAACGAGRSLSAVKMTDADIAESVRVVTSDPGYRLAAGGLAAEMAAQPSPADVVAVLEDIAAR
jgi:UDP:flavonoid glycosyltransferase YjiC (YdhE family)